MSGVKICPTCENQYAAELRFCPTDGATLRASEAGTDLIGLVVADRYVVLEPLGEGGMGRVYLAEHVRMGRRSALKVMHHGMVHDADAIARFNREAANASRISHPNVAAIYDFGETSDGLIYLAMEYVEGEPLTALIERQGALPAPRAAAIAAQVADALGAAHDIDIVHRDLKPDNVMIGRGRDGSDVVKVVDFGIAKALGGASQRVTRTGYIVGTPEYMSPEQLAGDALDGRSDIYALGLLTFHMLTGTLPFPSATVQESMLMRLTERPRTLAEVRGEAAWPPALQAVLDRALAREARHRYEDARALRQDLLRAVESMPALEASMAGTLLIGARKARDAKLPAAGALPATRIAGAGPAAGAPVERRARPQRRLIRGAIAVGLLVTAIGAYMAARGNATGAVDGSHVLTRDSPGRTAIAALDPVSRDGDTRGSSDPVPARPVPPPIASPIRAPTVDGRAELDALGAFLEAGFSADRGHAGLARIDALLPRLPTRSDTVEALYRRAEAYAMLERKNETCGTLSAIGGEADLSRVSAGLRAQITTLRDQLSCPP